MISRKNWLSFRAVEQGAVFRAIARGAQWAHAFLLLSNWDRAWRCLARTDAIDFRSLCTEVTGHACWRKALWLTSIFLELKNLQNTFTNPSKWWEYPQNTLTTIQTSHKALKNLVKNDLLKRAMWGFSPTAIIYNCNQDPHMRGTCFITASRRLPAGLFVILLYTYSYFVPVKAITHEYSNTNMHKFETISLYDQ